VAVARGMDNHTGYAGVELGRCSRQAFRCHHPQGQGGLLAACSSSLLTVPDRIRPPPSAPRTASRSPGLDHAQSGPVPRRTEAHPAAAVRVSGEPGNTDDRVEGRPQRCRQRPRRRSSNTALRPGLPPRPPRGSHAWTEDRTHSTSERAAPRHQSTAFPRGPDTC
jgi:hypothetical protein